MTIQTPQEVSRPKIGHRCKGRHSGYEDRQAEMRDDATSGPEERNGDSDATGGIKTRWRCARRMCRGT